ncbi:MAG: hypothetical protein ACREP7_12805 [Lysobacter sp.]
MTAFSRTALMLLVIGAGAIFTGSASSQPTPPVSPATTQWICFYTSDQHPEAGEIGFLEEGGRRCPFVRNDPSLGQLIFVRRVPWN